MSLTKKQIKYINKNSTLAPDQLARKLNVNARDVKKYLKNFDQQDYSAQHLEHLYKKDDFLALILPKAELWLLLGLLLLAPFVYLKGIYDFANLPKLAFIQLGSLLLFFLWQAKYFFLESRLKTVIPPLSLPLALFLGWSLLSFAFIAHNKYEGFLTLLHWSACGLFFFLTHAILTDIAKVKNILSVIVFAGTGTALLGIGQALDLITFIPQAVAPAAAFANKNMAAQIIIISLPLCLGLFAISKKAASTWLHALAGGCLFLFLIMTKTRAAWLAAAVQLALSAGYLGILQIRGTNLLNWNRQKSAVILIGFVFSLSILMLFPKKILTHAKPIITQASSIFSGISALKDQGASGADSSASLRTSIWLNTYEMIKDNPISGVGIGNHKIVYPLYHNRRVKEQEFSESSQLVNVHNDFLQTSAELGITGFALLAWLAWQTICLSQRSNSSQHHSARLLGFTVNTALIGLLINACFSFPFQNAVPPFYAFVLLATLPGLYDKPGSNKTITLSRQNLAISSGIIALCFVSLCFTYAKWLKADRHYLKIVVSEKAGNWHRMIEEARQALQLNPHRTKILSYKGRGYVESGLYDDSIADLEKVLQDYPNHINAMLNLGVAYDSVGRYDQALEVYHKLLTIMPDYDKAHNNLANVYMMKKEFKKALEEFKRAAELSPNAIIMFNVGIAALKNQLYQEAADAFSSAAAIDPGMAMAQKNLGLLYLEKLNQPQKGIEYLSKALQLNPEISDAKLLKDIVDNFVSH